MITIYYCELCHLRAPAEAIAAALQQEFQLKSELREGFWGTFQVLYNDQEVFNRWKHRGLIGRIGFGSTPKPAEIIQRLRPFLAASQAQNRETGQASATGQATGPEFS